ncbi:beta-phosphoglucomutase [Ligilactobacillus salitolerans]|uniref:Beta-phosphoglucomutase n=1 Tax=Ligilactobacillus salitolerans TaxID=1808352 RepID=A0A401IRB6_9LACO|nr:beta-phosphoglucomutase [Ligilactobacillus salitolerans]GBG94080.1 beta-phosphoglucomutase [Ligilactobacillus salitolerans]
MQGILFDVDGILTDTAKFHFAAWSRLAQEKLQVELPVEFESNLKGVSRVDSLVRIMEYAGITDQYSLGQITALANEKNAYYVQAISQLTKADILPGIVAFLQELKEHDIPCAVASASKNAPLILKNLGLNSYFAVIADPAQVKHGKPAPDLFLAAAQKLQVPIQECVGIEDAVAGVAAIKAAGAVAVAVGDKIELQAADRVVSTTADLNYTSVNEAFRQSSSKKNLSS